MRNKQETITEINRCKLSLEKTSSPTLRRDYGKHIKRLQAELKEYDYYGRKYDKARG